MCFIRMPAPRNGGQRLIHRRRAWELLVPPRSCRRTLPLFIPDNDPGSWLRRDGQAAAVNGFEDFIAAAAEQRFPYRIAQCSGVVEIAIARLAQQFRAVGVGDDGFEVQFSIPHCSERSNGDLAASAEAVEQRSLASSGGAGGSIVQKCQVLAGSRVAFADFDAERALSSGGAHDLGGNDLLDQLRFAQALQPGRSQDDGIVFALFEFAQPRIDVAPQGMNVAIGADGLQLRLAAQAGRSHARALWQVFNTCEAARTESIARILPFRDGGDFESRGKLSGQVDRKST